MATTFLKRQKEMKRLEKQREKAERRAQKKLAGKTGNEIATGNSEWLETPGGEEPAADIAEPPQSEPQN